MKRFVHGLLITLLLCGSLGAKTYSDKSFLMPRPHGVNLAMESTTWHKQTALIDENKFGGTVQVTGFYDKSNNKKELGQYFGVCNYDNSTIDDFITVVPVWANASQPMHVEAPFIFHTPSFATSPKSGLRTLADKLTWKPYRESYGIVLDYHQKLDKLLKGLFFKVKVPLVHVKTSLGWSSSCCASSCSDPCSTPCSSTTSTGCVGQKLELGSETTGAGAKGQELGGSLKYLADYLQGNVTNTDRYAGQAALCYAKIHNGKSETGIADIDVILGYNFLYDNTKHLNVNVGVTIPTGNTPDGVWLWEPVVGNGGHWAVGAGLDAAYQLWADDNKSLDLLFAFNYRYLFDSTEKRTLGWNYYALSGYVGKQVLYGWWQLGAKIGDTQAIPLANYLTRDLKVSPGSQFDGILQLAFNWENWTFDLGYNLYAKEAETVKLKGGCKTSCGTGGGWDDDTYFLVDPRWTTFNAFIDAASAGSPTVYYRYGNERINTSNLDFNAAETPSVITHKLYGGVGYAFSEWEYPLMLGIGGSYEWATDNDCLEQWSLWLKGGITF